MAARSLVDGQIRDGQQFINMLVREGFEVAAAAWQREYDSDSWQLLVVSPEVDRRGLMRSYEIIQNLLATNRQLGLDLSDVGLLNMGSRFGTALRNVHQGLLGGTPVRGYISGFNSEELLIYPRVPSVAEWNGKSGLLPDEVTMRARDLIRLRGNDEVSHVELRNNTHLQGIIEGMKNGTDSMELLLRLNGSNTPTAVPVTDVAKVY